MLYYVFDRVLRKKNNIETKLICIKTALKLMKLYNFPIDHVSI